MVRLPDWVFTKYTLRVLHVSNNSLSNLPPELGQLHNLLELIVNYNSITGLPDEIYSLFGLRKLHLRNNRICRLSSLLGNLTDLREIDLAHNCLRSIPNLPTPFAAESRMKFLDASHNKLTTLPHRLDLFSLTTLNLQNNQLDSVPTYISSLTDLRFLDLRNNQLRNLPIHSIFILMKCKENRVKELEMKQEKQLARSRRKSSMTDRSVSFSTPMSSSSWLHTSPDSAGRKFDFNKQGLSTASGALPSLSSAVLIRHNRNRAHPAQSRPNITLLSPGPIADICRTPNSNWEQGLERDTLCSGSERQLSFSYLLEFSLECTGNSKSLKIPPNDICKKGGREVAKYLYNHWLNEQVSGCNGSGDKRSEIRETDTRDSTLPEITLVVCAERSASSAKDKILRQLLASEKQDQSGFQFRHTRLEQWTPRGGPRYQVRPSHIPISSKQFLDISFGS